mgnify:CR=1 FL=1
MQPLVVEDSYWRNNEKYFKKPKWTRTNGVYNYLLIGRYILPSGNETIWRERPYSCREDEKGHSEAYSNEVSLEVLKMTLLFKISILALYSSWEVAQESRCQSEKHMMILKELTSVIISNKDGHIFKCNEFYKVEAKGKTFNINHTVSLKK